MSVDVNIYLIYGVEVDYKFISDNHEKYEPFMEGRKSLPIECIFDGMNGEYAVVGKILKCIKEDDGSGIYDIPELSDAEKISILADIVPHFGVPEQPPKLMLIHHYH